MNGNSTAARLARAPARSKKKTPREPVRLDFGKHRGTPLEEVPSDYLEWLQRERRPVPDYVHDEISRRWIAAHQNTRSGAK